MNEILKTIRATYQNATLGHRVLDLIPSYYLCLLEDLECVELPVVFLLHEDDLAVGAFANDGDHLKVFLGNVAASSLLLVHDTLLILSIDHLLLFSLFLWRQSENQRMRVRKDRWLLYLLWCLEGNLVIHLLVLTIHILVHHVLVCCLHFYFLFQ